VAALRLFRRAYAEDLEPSRAPRSPAHPDRPQRRMPHSTHRGVAAERNVSRTRSVTQSWRC